MVHFSLRLLLCIFITIALTGCGDDSEEDIDKTQQKLKILSQAIHKFQSEEFFGKAPKSLEELYHYETSYFNAPKSTSLFDSTGSGSPAFTEYRESFSLIPDRRIFLKSGLDKDDEDEILNESEFTTDFEFLPNYQMFLPPNTIIAWDKAGNFNSGGNILFEDGSVKFLKIPPEEYTRLTTALKTQTDRDFVRDLCIRNNTDCSLVQLKRSPTK